MYNNINLVQNSIEKRILKKKKKSLSRKIGRIFLSILLIYFVVSFFLSSKAIFSQESLGRAVTKLPVVSQLRGVLGMEDELISQDSDRLNFLLMGIGGAGHDGALLTDTMILVSIQLSTKQVSLISIPRDLYVKIPSNGWQRINSASAYGDLNDYPGGGSALAAKTVSETFGVPIDYWLRIDFNGFKDVIDDIGGVDIYIDRSFTDNLYPTDDFLVQSINFNKGEEHMDGERALQFARSRHGNNGEGSDFSRSKRQQKILLAVKDKILSWKTLANPNKIYKIFDSVASRTQTNIGVWELSQIINLMKEVNFDTIEHYVIDDSPGGLLKPIVTEDGAQVLAPKNGDLGELQDFVKNIFVIKSIIDNKSGIIIANGTTVEGLATYVGGTLSSWGFTIERLITSPRQDFEKTVIYDLRNKQEGKELEIIKARMNANVSKVIPEFLNEILYRTNDMGKKELIKADYLIVLGTDQIVAIQAIEEWRAKQKAILEKNNIKDSIKTENIEDIVE